MLYKLLYKIVVLYVFLCLFYRRRYRVAVANRMLYVDLCHLCTPLSSCSLNTHFI